MESPKIFPICHESCLSNFGTISKKGADGINKVSILKNDNFKVTSGMHVQVSCKKNYARTPGVPGDISRNKSPYLLYGTLMGLIISKVFALNRETIFQSKCPDLPSDVQELKDMVSQLTSTILVKTNCRAPDHS